MAIEIVDFPIKSMVDLSSSQTVSHYQRSTTELSSHPKAGGHLLHPWFSGGTWLGNPQKTTRQEVSLRMVCPMEAGWENNGKIHLEMDENWGGPTT